MRHAQPRKLEKSGQQAKAERDEERQREKAIHVAGERLRRGAVNSSEKSPDKPIGANS